MKQFYIDMLVTYKKQIQESKFTYLHGKHFDNIIDYYDYLQTITNLYLDTLISFRQLNFINEKDYDYMLSKHHDLQTIVLETLYQVFPK